MTRPSDTPETVEPPPGESGAATDDATSRNEVPMIVPTLTRTVQITNPLGFHMRPKMGFARLASQFDCAVTVSWQGRSGNGKSMWDLMLVAAPQGDEVTVEVAGPDAGTALEALVELLAAPSMGEDYDGLAENI